MLGRSSRWAYANTRLRVHLGALKPPSYFRSLVDCGLDEALRRLAADPPGGIEWPVMTDPYAEDVGALLYQAYEGHFLRISKWLDEPYRSVFILTLEHVAIDDIKHLIRRIVGGRKGADGGEARYLALGRSSLVPDLRGVDTLDELDEALADTNYAAPYRLARSSFDDTGEILAFEVALDLDYHKRLDSAINSLPGEDAVAVDRIFRRQCDIKNLGWILRYRFEFQLKEVEIFNYTLSVGFELNDDLIMTLARLDSPSQVLAVIENLPVGRFLAGILPSDRSKLTVIDIEAGLDRYWEHMHKTAVCTSTFGLLPFVCYEALKELERDRVERVIVGLQLGLDASEIYESLWLAGGDDDA